MQFSRLTRRGESGCPDFVNEFVGWGAGPRASQYLILAGKARALLKGRYHVSTEDIRQVALPVLRHRIVTNFNAEAENVKSDTIVKRLIEFIPRQQYDELDKTASKMMRDAAGGLKPAQASTEGRSWPRRRTIIASTFSPKRSAHISSLDLRAH